MELWGSIHPGSVVNSGPRHRRARDRSDLPPGGYHTARSLWKENKLESDTPAPGVSLISNLFWLMRRRKPHCSPWKAGFADPQSKGKREWSCSKERMEITPIIFHNAFHPLGVSFFLKSFFWEISFCVSHSLRPCCQKDGGCVTCSWNIRAAERVNWIYSCCFSFLYINSFQCTKGLSSISRIRNPEGPNWVQANGSP